MYLAILGYVLLAGLIFFLLKGKATPVVLFIVLPIAIAILAGYNPLTINDYIKTGVTATVSNAVLFCFSILFFNFMNEVGVFDPIVNGIMKIIGKNVFGVCIAVVLVAIIGHLDGSSTTTILIVIPFFLPIFKKMKLDPKLLMLLGGTTIGVMNLSPWAGAINRVSIVTKLDVTYLWHRLLPMQGVGIAVALVMAVIYGHRAIQAGAGLSTGEILDVSPEEKKSITWKYWVNLFLTAGTIFVLMVFPKIQAYVVFMLVTAIAAIFNYGDQKLQTSAINRFAPAAFFITATMLASGVFVGILSGGEPSILTEMATLLLRLLPPFLARHLHLIMAFLSSGFGLVFSGDAYLLGVLPLCIEAGSRYGIPPEAMGLCMVIGKNVAMIGSPIFASTYLTLSLAGVELKDYLKYAFVPMWITSLIMILSGLILGIIPL